MKKSLGPELDRDDDVNNEGVKVGYIKLLKNKRVFFAGMSQFINIIAFTSGQPLFGPRLSTDYGFSNLLIGFTFAVPTIAYILTGPLLLPLIAKKFESRATMMCGFFILGFSMTFVGPSNVFGFPDTSTAMMIIGLIVLGTGAACTVIPVIPEMMNAVEGQYEEHSSEVSDTFSGIFNIAGGFGQIVGPSVAGVLADQVGFNWTFDIVFFIIIGYNIIYILVCGGFGSIGRSFKATIARCKRQREPSSVDSADHRLLQEEESDTQTDNDEETTKGEYTENPHDKSGLSTDTSLVNSYGIN